MNRTYEEWLKYYGNATKEQVIEDMMLDIKELKQLKKQKEDVVEYCNKTIESLNWKKRDIMQILTPENGYLKADIEIEIRKYEDILRMLGEIDE